MWRPAIRRNALTASLPFVLPVGFTVHKFAGSEFERGSGPKGEPQGWGE
jgi:hypothetical protein